MRKQRSDKIKKKLHTLIDLIEEHNLIDEYIQYCMDKKLCIGDVDKPVHILRFLSTKELVKFIEG